MSSKKARRRKEYLEREEKRRKRKEAGEAFDKAMDSGNIEAMAAVLGVNLN